jgi:ABC-type transporter MlaC component
MQTHYKHHGEIHNNTVEVLTSRNREGYTFATVNFLAEDEDGNPVEVSYQIHASNNPGNQSITVQIYDYQTNATEQRVVGGCAFPEDEDE